MKTAVGRLYTKDMTKTISYRQQAVLAWVLPILFQITLWGCSGSQDQLLLSLAKDDAAKKFAEQVVSAPRCREIRQISVMQIDNDRDNSVHEALNRRLVTLTSWDVAPLPASNIMNKILEVLGEILQRGEIYDPNTLTSLGKMMQARHVVNGKITTFRIGPRSAWIDFKGQVLDLERGTILFSGVATGTFRRPLETLDLALILMITVLLCFVLGFLSRRSYFTREKAKQALFWVLSLVVWGLGVWWYYFSYI